MKTYYRDMYTVNETSGDVLIEIALADDMKFFHDLDCADFEKRDIHPELVDFLEECSNEIPLEESVEIRLNLKSARDVQAEQRIRSSFEHYYRIQKLIMEELIKKMYRKIGFGVVLAVVLLLAAHTIELRAAQNLATFMLVEGFYIGGWVFLWEAIYALGFERQDEKKKLKEAKRLIRAKINFMYSE